MPVREFRDTPNPNAVKCLLDRSIGEGMRSYFDATQAAGDPVADLACGAGRNALAVAARGHRVIGVDRSREHLGALAVPQREQVVLNIRQMVRALVRKPQARHS